ncbi:MAG: DUF4345 family protein, partial [Gammaproteobacteria bacterium]|nr:DUF4345 family protein [Gammaproteobacteria bacterium]
TNAFVIGLIGIAYLIDPNILLVNYNMAVTDAGFDNFFRAGSGGLFLALAIGFGLGAIKPEHEKTSLLILLLFMGGLALGRAVSMLAMGLSHPMLGFLFAYEVLAALVAAWLLKRTH